MSLLNVLIVVAIVLIVQWMINMWVPMNVKIKNILNLLITITLVIWLLKILGVIKYLSQTQI